jgi:hypothetical protein
VGATETQSQVIRNLLFFVYPLRTSCWPWHFKKLEEYQRVFNGRKVVVIAKDSHTDDTSKVRELAASLNPTFVEVENDPTLWEVPAFHNNLSRFESLNSNELLFYAHAKGVRHAVLPEGVMAWSECMYMLNLSNVGLIDRISRSHKAIGAFRHEDHGIGGKWWHYSGTFFWLRHDALFSAQWKVPGRDRFGVETFPGRIVPLSESFDLTSGMNFDSMYESKPSIDRCRKRLEELGRDDSLFTVGVKL